MLCCNYIFVMHIIHFCVIITCGTYNSMYMCLSTYLLSVNSFYLFQVFLRNKYLKFHCVLTKCPKKMINLRMIKIPLLLLIMQFQFLKIMKAWYFFIFLLIVFCIYVYHQGKYVIYTVYL